MKPLLILFILSLIAFDHCENIPVVGEKKKPPTLKKFNESVLFVCFIGRFMEKTETTIIDNKDGTIALAEISTRGTDYCLLPLGKTESINVKYYIKKCIQGQVYRSAQNDCKGTGTAANYYGAQKFQLCSTSPCDSVSPASDSCSNDNFNNIKWEITTFYQSEISQFYLLASYFLKQLDIPNTKLDYYWVAGYAYNMIGDKYFGSRMEPLYVSCFKRINS